MIQMTGDALSVGGILAVAGIPRALFMLIGGAITDKFSPRKVMFVSNLMRMVAVLTMALLAITNSISLGILYLLVLFFGIADAFFFPAQNTIIPQLLKSEHLQIGNAIIQGTAQVSRFAGPVLAGLLIAILGDKNSAISANGEIIPDLKGIGLAFGIESLSFLISALTLWFIKTPKIKPEEKAEVMVWKSIKKGLLNVWNDKGLRILFFVITAVNFLVIGPILVGIPVLADTRFVDGAMAFGIIMSAFGGGNLLGTILAGTLPPIRIRLLGLLLGIPGIGMAIIGVSSSVIVISILCLVMGIANGYVTIIFITWLQKRTPKKYLGRVMSVMIFFVIGLNPISMAVSGFLSNFNLTYTFVISGVLMTTIVLLAYFSKSVSELGEEMVNNN